MTPEQWWKNFGMGLEIDAAGAFIYNAIYHLHKLSHLSDPIDSFEILYGLSVGIERLQKVAIILLEHEEEGDVEKFEKNLISHNTIDLSNRIDKSIDQKLSGVHKELLSLLSKFYKSHRYGRYSFTSLPNIDAEKEQFIGYLKKHLSIDVPDEEMLIPIANTDKIRKFVGKVVKKIVGGIYEIVKNRASDIGLFTYELRSDSKAMKVFLGERLDFLDEEVVRREILLFLISTAKVNKHLELIDSIGSLELDPGLIPSYIKALLNDAPENFYYIADEVVELFSSHENKRDRIEMLKRIDSDVLIFDEEELDEQWWITNEI